MILRVGTYAFDVIYSDEVDEETNAYTSAEKQKIVIRNELHSTIHRVVLLHEVMHAIYYAYGHKDRNDEEATINFLSKGMIEVLQNNKWLRDALGVENV